MNPLETKLLDFTLKNPLIMASGTYGFGRELEMYYSPNILGGISSKGLTRYPKPGNSGIRIWETPSGMLNSIGLENPGVEHFCEYEVEDMRKIDTLLMVNLGGNTLDEYIEGVEFLNEVDIDILELNISCPNVKEGGMAFGLTCDSAAKVTSEVVKRSKHPVIVKLSPNGEDVSSLAKSVEDVGACGVSLINTLQGMAVDVKNKRIVFDNIYAGLSGPAVKPIALRMVHQVAKAVSIPVIGLGGISNARDVLEFLMVGATCVQIGTANLFDPRAVPKIIEDLEIYCIEEGIKNLSEICGIL
ncbi:MAG: dihydroorotate dehydrogenase [Tissierellia bacterium]|nr:dihydroorotate dehydrogenase [Tissierellia bacterium]